MAQSIDSSILQVTLSGSVSDTFALMVPNSNFEINENQAISNGDDTNQGNFVWSKIGKLAASGSNTIDLKGTETDIFGNTMDLDTLKVVIVRNTSDQETGGATTSSIRVSTNGIGFLSGTTPKVEVGPGSAFCTSDLAAGWALTDTTADTITIENVNANAHATYELMILGVQEEASSSSSSFSSASSLNSSSSSSSS